MVIQCWKIMQKKLLFQHWQKLPTLQSYPKKGRRTYQKESLKYSLTIHLIKRLMAMLVWWELKEEGYIYKFWRFFFCLFQKAAYPSFKAHVTDCSTYRLSIFKSCRLKNMFCSFHWYHYCFYKFEYFVHYGENRIKSRISKSKPA